MGKIVPHRWFDKEAVEATEFYVSVFSDSKVTHKSVIKDIHSGDCDIVGFTIMGFEFMAISAGTLFTINPSISFFVNFDPSYNKDAAKDIDDIWSTLSAVSEAEQCGWLKDKYGLSWQVVPVVMDAMIQNETKEQVARLTQTFLQMKKFDIKKLNEAYEGN